MADKHTELAALKRLPGSVPVKNSGRGINKGDGVWGPFLVDVKEYAESFSVSRKVWAKLSSDSIQNQNRRLQPMFFLLLGDKSGATPPVEVMVVGKQMGIEMKEAWEEKYGSDQG